MWRIRVAVLVGKQRRGQKGDRKARARSLDPTSHFVRPDSFVSYFTRTNMVVLGSVHLKFTTNGCLSRFVWLLRLLVDSREERWEG